jgi:hypothetical protein
MTIQIDPADLEKLVCNWNGPDGPRMKDYFVRARKKHVREHPAYLDHCEMCQEIKAIEASVST